MIEQRARLDRAVTGLGLTSVLAGGYVFLTPPTPLNWIHAGPGGAIVLIVFGVLAIVAGRVESARVLALVAGVGLATAAVYHLVSLVVEPLRILGGDASLFAVLGGLGSGLILVALTGRALRR